MRIADHQRKEGVRDALLVNEELSTERVLQVHWNVEKRLALFETESKYWEPN